MRRPHPIQGREKDRQCLTVAVLSVMVPEQEHERTDGPEQHNRQPNSR